MADDPKLAEDQLVQKLVPDPSQGPPNATVLRGYLGRGTGKDSWRLYMTAALDEYVELAESDILHTQKLPGDQGTLVWVPKTLALHYVRVHSDQVQADFLQGHIAVTRMGSGAGAPGAQPRVGVPSIATVCSIVTCPPSVRCLSHTPCPSIPCITAREPCPVSQPPCPSVPCETIVYRCPPSHPPCPSVPCQSYTVPCVTHPVPCPLESHTPCPSIPCRIETGPTWPSIVSPVCPTGPIACRTDLTTCGVPVQSHTICATPTAVPSHVIPCSTWAPCPIDPDPDDSEK
jgi:hypothetical protein